MFDWDMGIIKSHELLRVHKGIRGPNHVFITTTLYELEVQKVIKVLSSTVLVGEVIRGGGWRVKSTHCKRNT